MTCSIYIIYLQIENHTKSKYLIRSKEITIIDIPIKDFDVFWGQDGWFHYLRQDNKGKISKRHDEEWFWNGRVVEGIEELLKKDVD